VDLFRRRRRQLSEREERRLAIATIRSNLAAMGIPVDDFTDEQIEEGVKRFGDLASMAAISSEEAMQGLSAIARAGVSAEEQLLTRDDVHDLRQVLERVETKPEPGTHDDAGELLALKGGPMDGYLVREGAPVLKPDWDSKGRYVRTGTIDEDTLNQVAEWEPA
jgi:hypothetical protein